jgi:Zn finger protein HypA/HybF involved in hydrogenase expression
MDLSQEQQSFNYLSEMLNIAAKRGAFDLIEASQVTAALMILRKHMIGEQPEVKTEEPEPKKAPKKG